MSISLYNTLSKKKEPFAPLSGNKVRMYVCGVTVYDMSHIGHARSLVVFDVIARFLRRKGYDLTYVRNFTDVDDKIIARANQLGSGYKEIAQKYIDEFNIDMETLKVKPADIEPRATEYIEHIIAMIVKLESKGLAYKAADGSWTWAGPRSILALRRTSRSWARSLPTATPRQARWAAGET